MSDITIVTAFFDIGRGNWPPVINGRIVPPFIPRSTKEYLAYFELFAKIDNDMIVYTSIDYVDAIKAIRKKANPNGRIEVVPIDFEEACKDLKPAIVDIMRRPEYIALADDPTMPEYWNADYVLVNFFKTEYVNHAYDSGLVKTPLAAWIDFGYVRDNTTVPKNNVWKYDFDPKKMHYFNLRPLDMERPIFDIIKTNTVYMMGCHMVGGKEAWKFNKQANFETLNCLLRCGLIDDDQTFLFMNFRAHPDKIEVHPIDISQNGWYAAMTKYNTV